MRYDDDKFFDNGDENDLWDDELEINSDDPVPSRDFSSGSTYAPHDSYYSDYDSDAIHHSEGRHDVGSYPASVPKQDEDGPDDYYSDPEPAPEAKPKHEGFFRRSVEEEDEDNDYFDSDDEPAPKVKKQKTPKLDPEDPDYWIEEESPIRSIIHKSDNRWKWWLGMAVGLLVLILFSWIWFLRPYADDAVKYGYIKNMERRGSLIKTFEGSMIPYKELGDPDPFYFREVRFSVASDSLAAVMKRMMLEAMPVRVEYEMYRSPLPWKGEEKMIIIKADTADPRKILPPEYRR
ncbi:MAG: hypothetical protein K2L45_00825 [Muribaculaceae bacterium]|nr:hypothetical protein [Muribaculaceae bacterium]